METTSSRTGNVAHVVVVGEVDAATSPLLESSLVEMVAGGATVVTLDLSGVTFLSSSGLSALLQVNKVAESVIIQTGNRLVERILALTELTQMFSGPEIHER